MFDTHKTRMIGLPCGEEFWQYVKQNFDVMSSRFNTIQERDGLTDGGRIAWAYWVTDAW